MKNRYTSQALILKSDSLPLQSTMPRFCVPILAAAVFLLGWIEFSAVQPRHESGTFPIDPPTPYIHYFGGSPSVGRVLVVHGLDVSKEVMSLISSALADGGFEVYSMDLPGHGDSPANFQTDMAQRAISKAKAFLGGDLMVLGHSTGATLLLDASAKDHFSTLILLSPPPISIGQINANHVLVVTSEFDIPAIRRFGPIVADVGQPNIEAWTLPWGGHAAAIFNPQYIQRIVGWMGGNASNIKTARREFWIVLMFVAAVVLGVSLLPGTTIGSPDTPGSAILTRYVAAGGVALLVLRFANPLGWLRLFATDYLIGFLLVTGVCLLAMAGKRKQHVSQSGVITAIFSAAFVIAIPGLLVASNVLHMFLTHDRWWRLIVITFASLPLFMADELLIRRMQPRLHSEVLAFLSRALFLALVSTGVLILNREKVFLLLIMPLITVFWIGLWFAAGVVHRHTQSPVAAAVFAAFVQGWAFAAWFVTN